MHALRNISLRDIVGIVCSEEIQVHGRSRAVRNVCVARCVDGITIGA